MDIHKRIFRLEMDFIEKHKSSNGQCHAIVLFYIHIYKIFGKKKTILKSPLHAV